MLKDLSARLLAILLAIVLTIGGPAFAQEPEFNTPTPATSVLDQTTLEQMSSLVVNSHESLAIDFGTLTNGVNLSGNLTNNGSIYAYSTNPNVLSGTIAAHDIFNSGLITSVLPTGGIPGLTLDLSSLVSNFSLNLLAANNIVNSGTIASAGNLSLSAGGTITNAASAANMAAILSAVNNVNLQASNIVNSGVIAAMQGNINIASQLASSLVMNNIAGRLSALNGNINIRDIAFSGKHHFTLWGGDVLSQELNVFSGTGIANLNVNELTGMLNIRAGEAHVTATTAGLNLGTIELSGDPTFYNTSGDVIINSALSFSGQPLAIVAARDIRTASGASTISTTSSSGNGGAMTLIAGAQFTSSGASSAQPPPPGDTTSTLTITGASNTGGSIRLDSPAITSLTSSSTGGGGAGGNINLIAFQGSDSQSGTISLPTAVTITSGGNGSGTSGNVNIIAGLTGTSGNAITVGAINTTGGANNTGNITLITAQPVVSGGSATILNGTLTGSFISGTTTSNSISTGGLTVSGSTISVTAGNNALLGGVTANGTGSNKGGTVSITTNSTSAFNVGSATTNGTTGLIMANAGTSGGGGGTVSLTNSGSGGITVSSSNRIEFDPSASGGSGGTLSITTTGLFSTYLHTYTANATGSNFAGGQISIQASDIQVSPAGGSALDFTANGIGTGNGGTINITTTGTNSNINISNGSGNITVSAISGVNGGNGGTVAVAAGKDLTVAMSQLDSRAQGTDGNGPTISLTAGNTATTGNLLISGTVNANGNGIGNGGIITLISKSTTSFDIGAATSNGTNNAIRANATGTAGNGGQVTIINSAGGITLNDGVNIAANSSNNGNGGTISLSSTTLTVLGSGSYAFNPNGGGSGSGGSVSISTNSSTSNITVGSAAGQISISARSGPSGGNGGTISISAGNNLTVAIGSTFRANPRGTDGNGAIFSLTAGAAASPSTGNLQITGGNLDASGNGTGNGGSITLNSKSATTFTIGASTSNSVNGSLSANAGSTSGDGGTVIVQNFGSGGITYNTTNTLTVAAAANGNGGTIKLDAGTGIISTSGSGSVLFKAEGSGSGIGGQITLNAASYTISGSSFGLLDASGAASSGTGKGGKVNLTSTSSIFDLSISSTTFQIDISGGSSSGGAGETTISSSRDISVTTSALTNSVTANGAGATITLSAGRNLAISGDLNANGTGNGAGGIITLNSNSTTAFSISGGGSNGSSGALTANAGSTSGDGGQIFISNSGTGGIAFANTFTLTTSASAGGGNGGKLFLTSTAGDISIRRNNTLSVNAAGSGAFSGGELQITATALSVTSGGGSGPLSLTANAVGTGSGGKVTITTTNNSSSYTIGTGNGEIALNATGGSTSSAAGDGGQITFSGGANVTLNIAGVNANPLGSGKGATLNFSAGNNASASSGTLTINGGSLTANANSAGSGGSITLRAGVNNSAGELNFGTAGSGVQANGVGAGSGGTINISTSATELFNIGGAGSSTTNGTRAAVTANAGNTSGNGGSISITNNNGGVTLSSLASISLTTSSGTAGGNGGTLALSATGALNLVTGTLTLNALGTAGTTGGNVTLQGSTISTGGVFTINASGNQSGSGTGKGGNVSITATGTTGDITVNATNFVINARGGTTSGDGGSVTLSSGRTLSINTGSLNANPTAGNSTGAGYSLTSATAAAGNLQITGTLAANGLNNGNGGTIALTYSDATNPFVIGAAVTNSGVTGNLTATAPGSGTGGTISITNAAAASINISLSGTLSVASTSGISGQLNVFKPGQAIQIVGAGSIGGTVSGSGTSVLIQPNATNVAMRVGNLSSTAGGITIRATGTGSSVSIDSGATVSAVGGNVLIETFTVSNNGTITSSSASGLVTVQSTGALTLTGAGTVSQTGTGTPGILVEAVGANALNMNGSWVFNAGSSGTVTFRSQNASGSIATAAASIQLVSGGSTLTISTPLLSLASGSLISSYNSSGTAITINNGTAVAALTIRAPSSSLATISTSGANISLTTANNQALVFDKSSTALGTLNLNTTGNGTVTATTSAATTINANAAVVSDSNMTMNVNGGNIATVNGTFSTSKVDGILTIQSTSALTLSGTGTLSITGSGYPTINVQANGANALTIAGSLTYSACSLCLIDLQSPGSGGSVVVNAGTTQTGTNGGYFQFIAPQISFNGNATINNSDGYLDLTGNTLSSTITLADNSTVNINLGSGTAFVGSYNTQALVINKTAGANTATLQFDSEVQTYSYGSNQTIAANVTLASGGNITLNLDGGTLFTNGSIVSTMNGGVITLNSNNANLTLAGTPQQIAVTGGGAGAIIVRTQGDGYTINVNSSYTLNAGASGYVALFANDLNIGTSTTLSSTNSPISFFGQNATLSGGAIITSPNGVSLIASGGSNVLTITAPDMTSALISSTSGIQIQGNSIVFAKSAGGNTTFLNLNNSPVNIHATSGSVTINPSITVRSNNDITMQANAGGTFTINGTLESTKNGGVINISGNTGLTIDGSTAGNIKVSGTGANSISVWGFGSGLTLNNSLTLDAGSSGSAIIGAASTNMTMAANKTITFANGTAGSVQAVSLLLSGNNTITGTKTSGTALSLFAPAPNSFTLNLHAATSSTLATSGGAIAISSPQNINVGITGGTASDTVTLNLTGGPATITSNSGSTVLSSRVILNSQNDVTFNVNQITVGASGEINTSLGSISLIARTGTISIGNNVTMYANEGNLTIQNTDASGGTIDIASGADLTGFTLNNPGLGFVNIVIGPIPSLPVVGDTPANVTVNESGGGVVYFGTNSINAAAPNNTLNAKGRNIVFSTGDQGPTAITIGGNVTITADPPLGTDISQAADNQFAFSRLNSLVPTDTTSLNESAIATTVIPFDTSPASTVNEEVSDDTINNIVNQALEQSGILHGRKRYEEQSVYEPISYSPSVVPKKVIPATNRNGLYTLETNTALIKCTHGAKISIKEAGLISIKSGEALIVTNKEPQRVDVGSRQVWIDASAAVVISFEDEILKVTDIYDKGPHSVYIIVKDAKISLGAGQEAIIAQDNETIDGTMKQDRLGRRRTKSHVLPSTRYLAHSEVSLVSLLENNNTVNQLVLSRDPEDRALANRVLKMAACLMMATTKHGPYQSKTSD